MGILTDHRALAEELSRYSRLCYDRWLVGAAGGNLSVRVPGQRVFLVTASGVSLRDVSPDNLVVVDGKGEILENPGGLKPSKEFAFHLAIYHAKAGMDAVVHVHPAYATVYSAHRTPIPLATVSASLKLKQGAVVNEAHPGSQELCNNIVEVLTASPDDVTVLLLERHGVVAYGATLCDAFDDAELAEDTAKIAYLSVESRPTMGNIVDLTAPLNECIQCYPTDPPFKKSWYVEFEDAGSYVSKLEMSAHIGTHVDVPLHFTKNGSDIIRMSPDMFFGEAIAIDTPKKPGEDITPADLSDSDIRPGDIVLFRTGWEERASSPRFFEGEWPGFTSEAVDALITRKVKAIGGDIASADSPRAIQEGAPAHKRAFAAGLPVFEALVNMRETTGRRFFFIGLPLKLEDGEASPIRAVAILDWSTSPQ